MGNVSIDGTNSGIIKNGLVNDRVKYTERVSGRLPSQVP